MRKGYDSTSASDCPTDGDVYCGYNDGTYAADFADLKARFPHKPVWSIGRFMTSRANWYDCESGLLSPDEAATLAKGNIMRDEFAGIYVDESTWGDVKLAVKAAGIDGKVEYWIAWEQPSKDGAVPDGAAGRQYLLSPGLSPGHYDVSNWVDYVEGLDAAPPKPKPKGFTLTTRRYVKQAVKVLALLDSRLGKRIASHVPLDAVAKTNLRKLDAAMTRLSATIKRALEL